MSLEDHETRQRIGGIVAQRAGPSSPPDTHGSRTLTVESNNSESREPVGVLHLRGAENFSWDTTQREAAPARRVVWTEDTVDNEGMGKKKSKSMFALTNSLLYLPQATSFRRVLVRELWCE